MSLTIALTLYAVLCMVLFVSWLISLKTGKEQFSFLIRFLAPVNFAYFADFVLSCEMLILMAATSRVLLEHGITTCSWTYLLLCVIVPLLLAFMIGLIEILGIYFFIRHKEADNPDIENMNTEELNEYLSSKYKVYECENVLCNKSKRNKVK